ncbi:MAG: TonB-dependent receptor [Bacteroidetes bacterium]|nr:TonB-dependent receptor [Bacteroidota bacterium]
MIIRQRILPIIFMLISMHSLGQDNAKVIGKIINADRQPISLVSISIEGAQGGGVSGRLGDYEVSVPANKEVVLIFSSVGFVEQRVVLNLLPDVVREQNITLIVSTTDLPDFVVKDEQLREDNLVRVNPMISQIIPTISGEIEDVIKTLPGVSSNNELSSQYSVRGGNFDENLVYINGIEIYRPILIRSGQQEGLSFVNSDLVSSVLFSAGGFDAKYGDKMSSILDITYKKPTTSAGSATVSFLNSKVHIEGITVNNKLSYLFGARQKSNRYILSALDTKGDYKPSFTDFQAYLNYDLNTSWKISFLGNYARNSYKLIPTDRDTHFGTFIEAYSLRVYFEGQEIDKFETLFGAISLAYQPNQDLNLSFTGSAFQTIESEAFDITGQYWIGQLETNLDSEEFGNVIESQGVGTHINHARNYLEANVLSLEHKGLFISENQLIQWGFKFQHENIDDNLSEWEMIDSAYFSIPNPTNIPGDPNAQPSDLELSKSIKTNISLSTNRISSFIQSKWIINSENRFSVTAGLRTNYWDYNKQFLVSPRLSLLYKPDWGKDITFRFSTGYYYQPPFYKEIRNLDGIVNPTIKAQKSIHFVGSGDLNFTAWSRPFKLTTEIYYKYLDDLIPYKIDNVRIRYMAENIAKGYATGIDLKVNGEFVNGIESWASLSIMGTQEDIIGDNYWEYYNNEGQIIQPGISINNIAVDSISIEPGYIPRPTDQRFSFSLFLQDYLPKNPTYKIHLRLVFGSRLPFGPPDSPKYKDVLRIPPYRRVDIGFSKQLIDQKTKLRSNNPLKHLTSLWISAEIFNLFQINNTVSYLWIKDVDNRQYAIPSYLTPRQINVKLIARF